MTLYKWSQTAATDATADSTINWSEGQAPSSINDSARAMMAATAKFRDDNNGSLTTGGTSTAYTLTTAQVFDTLAHLSGQTLTFAMNATSGATPTLNVDSLGAKVIRNATGVALPTGALLSGSVYSVTYNNSSSEFLLHNQPAVLPTSSVVTASITDANVTLAKIVNTAASRLLGNPTGSAAAPSEISLGAGMAFSGTTLTSSITAGTGLTGSTALSVDYATKTEQQTGTATAKTVNSAHQQDHDSALKAWVAFNGNTGAIQSSYNVSGISHPSAGFFTISFTTAFASATYGCNITIESGGGAAAVLGIVASSGRAVGSVQINTLAISGAASDAPSIFVACYGRQ